MSDTVTSSAIAAGEIARLRLDQDRVAALFAGGRARPAGAPLPPDLEKALDDVADYPSIGAGAVIEMARADAGWSAMQGARNGLKTYRAFAANLKSSGWFRELPRVATPLPEFDLSDPLASVTAIAQAVHPDLCPAERTRAIAAMIRALAVALGPDGVPVETQPVDTGALGKPEVLERRVTTIASHVATMGAAPRFDMHWTTEVFTRTKDGKDDPKPHTDRSRENHQFLFNVQRWRTGDRSALIAYYRRVEDWLDDLNSTGGRARAMTCFAPILQGEAG